MLQPTQKATITGSTSYDHAATYYKFLHKPLLLQPVRLLLIRIKGMKQYGQSRRPDWCCILLVVANELELAAATLI